MHYRGVARRNPALPSTATVRELAVRIGCDPRSVEREILEPGSVSGVAGRRVRLVLAELGYIPRDAVSPLDRLGSPAGFGPFFPTGGGPIA